MSDSHGFLSDRWHLVAGLRVTLRPDCRVRRQMFRGQAWLVISDPFANRHFRVRAEAWRFLAQLDRWRTVDELWRGMIEHEPESAPGQREVIQVLAQLHGANLLVSDAPPETWSMVQRRERERQRAARQQWLNFLFLRIPLFDPNPLLEKLQPLSRVLIGPAGLVLWLIALALGGKAIVDHWGAFRVQTQGVLAPANLVWLYAVWALVKIFHELGHGVMTKRFGGEVRSCGVMLLVFTPVPFVDTSAAWAFREKGKRLLVGAGGMIFELFAAAIAAMVWARVGGEGTIGRVAYNVVFLASVSTLLFNANPLLKFDGYYLLADAFGVPNLQTRAAQQWRRWFERLGLGVDAPSPLARTRRGAAGLGFFGAASAVYRVFVLLVIAAFIGGQLFELGLLLAAVGLAVWLGGPLLKFYRYLTTDPKLQRVRQRAVAWAVGVPAAIAVLMLWIPMPHAVRAPGIVTGEASADIHADVSGEIVQLAVASGDMVQPGQVLVRLANPQLDELRRELQALRREVEARRSSAWSRLPAVLEPLVQRLRSIDAQLQELESQHAALTVTAPHAGIWSSPNSDWRIGARVQRGAVFGRLRSADSLVFEAVVAQRDVDRLTRSATRRPEVRLRGATDIAIATGEAELRPAESLRLPSPALGWRGGGVIPTKPDDPEGVIAQEPFFRLRAPLPHGSAPMLFMRTGVMRVALDPQPWGVQAWRRLRQFIQERYGR